MHWKREKLTMIKVKFHKTFFLNKNNFFLNISFFSAALNEFNRKFLRTLFFIQYLNEIINFYRVDKP